MQPKDLLSLVGILAVLAGILAGSYYFTRWAGQGLGTLPGLGGQNLRVLDRINVGRDQSVLLIKAGQRYLLLGCTPTGLTLLAELTQEEGENWEAPASPEGPEGKRPLDFRALMQRLREKK